METTEQFPGAYKVLMGIAQVTTKWWGRLEVTGVENLPASGPMLLCGNHDSYWDPLAIGRACYPRRQVHAMAKHSLWDVPVVGSILTKAEHIPVERGKGDGVAMQHAEEALRQGQCVGIFIEGTRSLGRPLRARSGLGHLAVAVPEAEIVCCTVTGTTEMTQFTRPKLKVDIFRPAGGGLQDGEDPTEFCQRLLDEIRGKAPRAIAGRKHRAAAARGELAD